MLLHLVNLLVLLIVELDAVLENGDLAEVGHAELVGVALLGRRARRLLRRLVLGSWRLGRWSRWLLSWRWSRRLRRSRR